MKIDWQRTRIFTELDFEQRGKSIGDLRLKHSDNRTPLGYLPIPAGILHGGQGPTVLLTGGLHGDEFEGPVALMKLLRRLDPRRVHGRLIILPALNAPAIREASRVSPLDQGNLNRAFPGDADGGPTAIIAHFVETLLLPLCAAVIDIHSGGKAATFAPCVLAGRDGDGRLSAPNMALAQAFGAPLAWILGHLNDNRSLNAAAARKGVPMIAVELGGGGHVSPEMLLLAERGIDNCLKHLDLLDGEVQAHAPARRIEVRDPRQSVYAPHGGLFEPLFGPGDEVAEGARAGYIHSIEEPERGPTAIEFPTPGVVLARCQRGLVERGELLALIASDFPDQPAPQTGSARQGSPQH